MLWREVHFCQLGRCCGYKNVGSRAVASIAYPAKLAVGIYEREYGGVADGGCRAMRKDVYLPPRGG